MESLLGPILNEQIKHTILSTEEQVVLRDILERLLSKYKRDSVGEADALSDLIGFIDDLVVAQYAFGRKSNE